MKPLKLEEISTLIKEQIKIASGEKLSYKQEDIKIKAVSYTHLTLPTNSLV